MTKKETTKQGEINKVGAASQPEFKGPGVEGKKVVSSVITMRDGGPKRILFGEDGKEIVAQEPPFAKDVPDFYPEKVKAEEAKENEE